MYTNIIQSPAQKFSSEKCFSEWPGHWQWKSDIQVALSFQRKFETFVFFLNAYSLWRISNSATKIRSKCAGQGLNMKNRSQPVVKQAEDNDFSMDFD